MGEIDKLYRAERDRAQMYRLEVERLRSANEGWAREVARLEDELRRCRAEIESGLTTAEWINSSLQDERRLADALGEELVAAREDVLHWAAYADPYFKEKWNLAGDLARIDAMLRRWQEARGKL